MIITAENRREARSDAGKTAAQAAAGWLNRVIEQRESCTILLQSGYENRSSINRDHKGMHAGTKLGAGRPRPFPSALTPPHYFRDPQTLTSSRPHHPRQKTLQNHSPTPRHCSTPSKTALGNKRLATCHNPLATHRCARLFMLSRAR